MRPIKFKRVLSLLLITAVVITMFPFAVVADGEAISANSSWPAKGDGTEALPYLIETESDLLAFASKMGTADLAGKHVKLTADMDLNPEWTASASAPTNSWPWKYDCFTGVFDGDGHTISGIYLNAKDSKGGDVDYVGIFGGFLDANKSMEIKNLSIVNSYVCGGVTNGYVGSLLGITSGSGTATTATFSNMYVDVIVSSNKMRVGGMVGYVQKGTVLNFNDCVFDGSVTTSVTGTEANIGGFVGRIEPSTTSTIRFDTCAFYGSVCTVSATDYIGGFIGVITNAFEENDIVFENCIVAGRIDAPAGAKNFGPFGKLSNSGAVLIMNNSLYVEQFYKDGELQSLNKPFNDGGATTKLTDVGEIYDIQKLRGLSALSLAYIEQGKWKASPENDYPLPASVYYMIYDVASDTELVTSPVTKPVGYQLSEVDAETGEFSIRLVAVLTVDDLNSYSKVGFKVQLGDSSYYTHECTTVYSNLTGKDTNDSAITYTAEQLGGKYIFALNINEIPTSVGDLTVSVTTFHVMATGGDPIEDCTSVVTVDASKIQ